MDDLKGYAGSILKVSLSNGSVSRIPTRVYYHRFLGGRGIATKIYWDEVPPEKDAFDPENRLIFTTGPITASTHFAGSRWQVCGKSAITNQFSYCNLGGRWGAKLKMAGYDALVVSGKAEKLSYLKIDQDGVKIKDASHLKGKGAISCRQILKDELGMSAQVVAVGPAGENRVLFATFLAENDSSGSGGLGAVMGSKNLKAIVVKGGKKIDVADREKVQAIRDQVRRLAPADELAIDHEWRLFEGIEAPVEKFKRQLCYDCIGGYQCMRKSYQSDTIKKSKFMCESIFYVPLAQRYYERVTEVPIVAAMLCDDYGLNISDIESIIRWLDICFRGGILTDVQTGIPLSKLGSLEYVETLIKNISFREGLGDALSQGVYKAAKALGPEAQKQIDGYTFRTGETNYYEPKKWVTNGLLLAMEPRLPNQLTHECWFPSYNWLYWHQGMGEGPTSENLGAIGKRFWGSELALDFSTYEGKALSAAMIQDRGYAKDSLILCDFMFPIYFSAHADDQMGDPTLESQLCAAVTGMDIDEQGLYHIGERVFNLQRSVLAREGHKGRENDTLTDYEHEIPLQSFVETDYECLVPGKDGKPFSRKGMVIDRELFEKLKDEFYEIRGWDVSTGLQKREKLEALDLGDIVDIMDSGGFLV